MKCEDEDDLRNMEVLSRDVTNMTGALLEGTFVDYLELMAKKHEVQGHPIENGESVILLNSFDGAEAIRSKDNLSTIISFSSQIFSANQIQDKHIASGSSFNILTWMQVIGKESIKVLRTVLSTYFESRQKILEGSSRISSLPDSSIWCYDVHDGKMQYELTQHSKWNRKVCPNLLCYCQRGEGLLPNHTCELMKQEDCEFFFNQSKLKYESGATSYDDKAHRD